MPTNADFLQKIADIIKMKRALVLKGIFSETAYVCVLAHQISSVISGLILTSFRHGPPQNGPLKSPPRLWLNKPVQLLAAGLFKYV